MADERGAAAVIQRTRKECLVEAGVPRAASVPVRGREGPPSGLPTQFLGAWRTISGTVGIAGGVRQSAAQYQTGLDRPRRSLLLLLRARVRSHQFAGWEVRNPRARNSGLLTFTSRRPPVACRARVGARGNGKCEAVHSDLPRRDRNRIGLGGRDKPLAERQTSHRRNREIPETASEPVSAQKVDDPDGEHLLRE